jgi:hypothetical protein
MKRLLAALIAAPLVLPPAAVGQPLDPGSASEYGLIQLDAAFEDPYRSGTIIGGGAVSLFDANLGADCLGYVSAQPTAILRLVDPMPFLRLMFIVDVINADAALIVRTPDGAFRCSDNAFGLLNPALDLIGAPAGDYAIWVASIGAGPVFGSLYATRNPNILPGALGIVLPPPATVPPPPDATPVPARVAGLDITRIPTYGGAALAAGFLPDPYFAPASGGGAIAVGGDALPPDCVGYTDEAPAFRVTWDGRSTRLRLLFIPIMPENADAALIVRAPDGSWACNADSEAWDQRPLVEFIQPRTGDYLIWIAHETAPYSPILGMVYVTEKIVSPETIRRGNAPPIAALLGLEPVGSPAVTFADAAISPDPYIVDNITAGGDVDIAAVNGAGLRVPGGADCIGYFPAAPSFVFALSVGMPYLRLFFIGEPDSDAVLIVQMPNGLWYCGDDSFGTLDPTVTIIGNTASGLVRAWVGSFRASQRSSGRLFITQGSASPIDPDRAGRVLFPDLPAPPIDDLDLIVHPPALDLDAPPNAAEIALAAGFEPDPYTIRAFAGGSLDAAAIAAGCRGAITPEPDIRLTWTGETALLRVFFISEGDAALVIRTPDGRFLCSDDAFGLLTPSIDMAQPAAGTYHIWLGSIAETISVPGTLYVTEQRAVSPINPGGG